MPTRAPMQRAIRPRRPKIRARPPARTGRCRAREQRQRVVRDRHAIMPRPPRSSRAIRGRPGGPSSRRRPDPRTPRRGGAANTMPRRSQVEGVRVGVGRDLPDERGQAQRRPAPTRDDQPARSAGARGRGQRGRAAHAGTAESRFIRNAGSPNGCEDDGRQPAQDRVGREAGGMERAQERRAPPGTPPCPSSRRRAAASTRRARTRSTATAGGPASPMALTSPR